jgi:hypothetical protein
VLVFRQNPLDGIETAVEDLDLGSERETDKVVAWRVEEVSLETRPASVCGRGVVWEEMRMGEDRPFDRAGEGSIWARGGA